MKILYFTFEDLGSGLFKNQVLRYLYTLKTNSNLNISLLVINRPWKYLNHRSEIKEIKKHISLIYIPLCPPLRYFTKNIFLKKIYKIYFSLIVKLFASLSDYDVIHCRHYLPSLICQHLKIKNYLFDVRSLPIYEYIQAGKIIEGSKNYNYWKSK